MKGTGFFLFLALLSSAALAGELYVANPPNAQAHWKGVACNQIEAKADIYKKLDVLKDIDGGRDVSSAFDWMQRERPKVVEFFEREVYGVPLPRPAAEKFELVESSDSALGGAAVRRQYRITLADEGGECRIDVLVYIPKGAKNPAPVFINENFTGNHTVCAEKEIVLPDFWLGDNPKVGIKNNKAADSQRGAARGRHPVEEIVARGYAFATFNYCQIFPDRVDGAAESVYRIFGKKFGGREKPAIAAWAWANSRVLDLLESVPEIDSGRAAVVGHSRLGKTALVTAVYDTRFAMCVSNNSGCMGADLSRRDYGENIDAITGQFPHWFLKNLSKYCGAKVEKMKADQCHMLACVAPRLLYVTSATKDYWADPKGEYFSLIEASKIYALFGAKDFPAPENLRVETPFAGSVGHHLREGVHDITPYDWARVMDFADKYWKR